MSVLIDGNLVATMAFQFANNVAITGGTINVTNGIVTSQTVPINPITLSSNYILSWRDSGQVLTFSNTNSTIININNTVGVGFRTILTQLNTGSVQVVAGANVVISPRTGVNNTITVINGSMSVFAYAQNSAGLYVITDGSIS